MSRVTAKLCGLSNQATLDAALAGGASHVGFVFFPPSPRNVAVEEAAALVRRARGAARAVGVFVDPDDALLTHAIGAGIEIVQLHGTEGPERAHAIRQRFGVELWRAVPVRMAADLAVGERFRGAADRLLFDARPPAGATLPGGLGLRFDWRLLEGYRHAMPWALSGGLDAASVGEAVAVTGATLVDVSSGVESAPGVKHVDSIAAFCQAVARL